MTTGAEFDAWTAGHSYDQYMGRWSRRIADGFLQWLDPPRGADWLEIGCGSGALTRAILATSAPAAITATDQSPDFVAYARTAVPEPNAHFVTADALSLPAGDATMDVVTSALVLNFIPDRPAALAEMQRVVRPDGLIGFYVWDYPGGGMGFIDAFWEAAAGLDSAAAALDEGRRFPFCTPEGLSDLCQSAGLAAPEIRPIEITTEFADFDSFWYPFTLGVGPAPGYCQSLPEAWQSALKDRLAARLGPGRPIRLVARAWGVKAGARS